MKVALIEPLGVSQEEIEHLAEPLKAQGVEFVSYSDKTTDEDELTRRLEGADVAMIANNPLPSQVIASLPDLRMIAVAFTGIDHVGLDVCKKRNITVCNCAGYSDVSVAELTLGLTIDVLRKVVVADGVTRNQGTSQGLMGQEIAGRTVGIVGTGHIGVEVGKRFSAFGARVLGYARHENPAATAAGIVYTPLDELLAQSDIVTLHVPLNDQTRNSFGRKEFEKMKMGSVFINCARGPIVNTEALVDALSYGKLAGAGIDVFDGEPPLPKDYALLKAKNTVLTPHVGFLTQEAMRRRAKIEFDNVLAWLSGEPTNVCEL
ncbi:MAG: 2-hydroxyacid dehydrogenase [Atopobiaceae bacterium]|jgi:phosphoglycerate dehydrogenase-like enzyme